MRSEPSWRCWVGHKGNLQLCSAWCCGPALQGEETATGKTQTSVTRCKDRRTPVSQNIHNTDRQTEYHRSSLNLDTSTEQAEPLIATALPDGGTSPIKDTSASHRQFCMFICPHPDNSVNGSRNITNTLRCKPGPQIPPGLNLIEHPWDALQQVRPLEAQSQPTRLKPATTLKQGWGCQRLYSWGWLESCGLWDGASLDLTCSRAVKIGDKVVSVTSRCSVSCTVCCIDGPFWRLFGQSTV